jgi:hypothetical protein
MNCFALRKGRCNALSVEKCEGKRCSFYKTEAQDKEIRKKVMQRINSLDKPLQMHISETYYGGKMPWFKGGAK